ncbi:hypothetical protein HYW99_03140 [Candidatus Woesearchaeota archaeon]|nr:hypothetical protein [Candidatus Woesearchaeota archaeon]
MTKFDPKEWSTIHFYSDDSNINRIVDEIIPKIDELINRKFIDDFLFFKYIRAPETHLKVTVHRNEISHEKLKDLINNLEIKTPMQKNIEFFENKTTQNIEGTPDFILSAAGRKLAYTLKSIELRNLNHTQIFFILHYFLNNISCLNIDEAKIGLFHIKNTIFNLEKTA